MSCSYKAYNTKIVDGQSQKCTAPYCKVTDGECQFVKDDKDFYCSIREEYLGDPSVKSE